jgi:hypothetical protein
VAVPIAGGPEGDPAGGLDLRNDELGFHQVVGQDLGITLDMENVHRRAAASLRTGSATASLRTACTPR